MNEMANVTDKIKMLEAFRLNPEKFLPVTDHSKKQFQKVDYGEEWYDDPWYNLGWDAGLLDGNRPYFMICWATCGITMLTYYISTEGIGEYGVPELLRMLEEAGLVKVLDPDNPRTDMMRFREDNGNEFFSVNIAVGDEDGTYAEGGRMYPFKPMNEYNRRNFGEGEKHESE